MYNSDTELICPLRVIPSLGSIRGQEWQQVVDRVSGENVDRLDQFAFILLMVKLGSCGGCNADSYRAMRGCSQCARQTIRRYRGSDKDLIEQFNQSRREVESYLFKSCSASRITGTGK
jgi:hypothetical protein